jgi:hypothetical protein
MAVRNCIFKLVQVVVVMEVEHTIKFLSTIMEIKRITFCTVDFVNNCFAIDRNL